MKKKLLVILLSIFCFQSFSQTKIDASQKLSKDLEKIYAQGHIVGFSVAITNDNGFLYNKGFGFSDKATNKKYTKNTIQNIASISKTFIGVALIKAQELGMLNLDDPINKYLSFKVVNPHFPEKEITIRQLATHTSSIKDPARYEKNGYILKEQNNGNAKVNSNFRTTYDLMLLSNFQQDILSKSGKWYQKKTFLKSSPGSKFEYSNIGAGLAALVIESASGISFREFTNEHIFKPLKMSDSGWGYNEIDFSKHSKLYANPDTELAFYHLVNYPDGGLITSTHDLGLYLTELMKGYTGSGTILSKNSYSSLFAPNLTDDIHPKRNKENEYNDEFDMGIFMGLSAKGQIGHTGGDPGVATFMFFNSVTNIGKILFVNTELDKEGVNEFISIVLKLAEFEDEF